MTGSAIAIPLLGAASANAADGTTWDKVAECESGGSWSADTGNGYYGGLQMSQDDWDRYGGLEYATTPDQASRSQQIAVAEKILADRGTKPWRTCALLSGLSSDDASVNVDTGLGGSADSSGSSDSSSGLSDSSSGLSDSSTSSTSSDSSTSSESSGSGSSAPSSGGADSATPSSSASASGDSKANTPTGSTGTDKSEPSGSGTSKASANPVTPEADDSDNSWQTGGSWSLVDTGAVSVGGKHRGDSADENMTKGQKSTSSGRHVSPDAGTYTVRAGDTLASIADSLGLDGGWHALYTANKSDIGADPNDITPGQTLKLGTETHVK